MASRYATQKVDGKTVLVHRHVMEQHLGRKLTRDEHVHHKNGNRRDNRLENLEVVAGKAHMRDKHRTHPLTKPCVICGTEFTPDKTKRVRAHTCSPVCANELRSRTERATKGARLQ